MNKTEFTKLVKTSKVICTVERSGRLIVLRGDFGTKYMNRWLDILQTITHQKFGEDRHQFADRWEKAADKYHRWLKEIQS